MSVIINPTYATGQYQSFGGAAVQDLGGSLFIVNGPVDVIVIKGNNQGVQWDEDAVTLDSGPYPIAGVDSNGVGALGLRIRAADGVLSSPVQFFSGALYQTGGGIGPSSGSSASASAIGAPVTIPISGSFTVVASPGVVTPVDVADPGAGVSTIPLYTVPVATQTTFTLLSYKGSWNRASVNFRRILLEMLDGSAAHFAWFVPALSAWYPGATVDTVTYETVASGVGGYGVEDFDTGSAGDTFNASSMLGQVAWPEGFTLRLVVTNMDAADAISGIRLLVQETS